MSFYFLLKKPLQIHFKQEMVNGSFQSEPKSKNKSLNILHWHKIVIILLLFTMKITFFFLSWIYIMEVLQTYSFPHPPNIFPN